MATTTQKIIIHADDQTGAAISSAIRNSKKLDNQLKKNTNNMRGMTRQGRAQMAQLGHQMQDIAVQLQMGMNPLMVLGQQGSQIASVFGSGGPVIGAFLAVGAVIASVFVPHLFAGKREAGEFHDEVIKAAGGVDKLTEAQRRLAELDLQLRINEQAQAVKDAQKAIDDLQKKIISVGDRKGQMKRKSGSIIEGLNEEAGTLNETLEISKAILASTQEQMRTLTGDVTFAANEAIRLMESNKISNEALASSAIAALDASANFARLSEEEKEAADKAKILAHSFELVNINFGMLANNRIPMAAEGFTTLNLKVRDSSMTFRKLGEDVKFAGMNMDEVGLNSIESIEDSLVSLIDGTKSVKDAFKSMARSVVNDLIRMTVQRQITAPLFNAMFGSTAPTIATASGYTTVGAGSPSGSSGQVLPGLEGGGFTGFGSRSGGVDGRGGFPAILHPNETVIDHTKSQGAGGGTNVTLNITTGVSQTVRAELLNLLPQIADAAKSSVADARMRGGSFSTAIGT